MYFWFSLFFSAKHWISWFKLFVSSSKSNEKEEYETSIEDLLEEVTNIEQTSQEIEIEYATEKQRIETLEEAISKIAKQK